MTDRILIDGTDLSWQAFADEMTALRRASERQGLWGQVRPPRGCDVEARRLVAHLDLADRIEVVGTAPVLTPRARAAAGRQPGLGSALRALLGWQPLERRLPTCD